MCWLPLILSGEDMTTKKALAKHVLSLGCQQQLTILQNIDFQTTILSRFDMIFIVKDEHNETRDKV